jgi:hypothetical protein
MTIRKPDFILVDECPDRCTIDPTRIICARATTRASS